MSYRFSLTRGQLVFLVLCLVLGGIVMFVGGMLTSAWRHRAGAGAAEAGAASTEVATPAAAGGPVAPGGQGAAARERIYEVQLVARLTREEAEQDVAALAAAGHQTYLWESRDLKGNTIFTVRMGPWPSANAAAAAVQEFRERSAVAEGEVVDGLRPVIRHRPKPPDAVPAAAIAPGEESG